LKGKPFHNTLHKLKLPTKREEWTVPKAINCLNAMLKQFGLQVDKKRRGKAKRNRRDWYALALSKEVDAAMSKVLAAEAEALQANGEPLPLNIANKQNNKALPNPMGDATSEVLAAEVLHR
jgi:hypothetical protein